MHMGTPAPHQHGHGDPMHTFASFETSLILHVAVIFVSGSFLYELPVPVGAGKGAAGAQFIRTTVATNVFSRAWSSRGCVVLRSSI